MTALENENDKRSIARKEEVQRDVDGLKAKLADLNKIWNAERDELNRAKDIQEKLDAALRDCAKARMQGDFNTAGKLMHGTIPDLEAELKEIESGLDGKGDESHKMLSEFVTADAIATCVARHTGIPVSKITGDESKKLLNMEEILRKVRSCISAHIIQSGHNSVISNHSESILSGDV